MEATEIMINDWFRTQSGQTIRILSVSDEECEVEDYSLLGEVGVDYVKTYDIEPIPLTEEILISNKIDTSEPFCFSRNHLIQLTWIDSKLYWTVNSEYSLICFDYVHQLQHALRLCGFNDIANDFKLVR